MFSWASIEPRRGEFHWDWLDEVFALLHGAGIRIDLGTPTAAPRLVLPRAPGITRGRSRGPGPGARVTGHGLPVGPGVPGRGHRHHPRPGRALRRPSRARALARPYEYARPCESFSTFAQDAFRNWALRRHGSLEAVNSAWGTAFWGQTFGVADEIHAPLPTPSMQNPSLAGLAPLQLRRSWSASAPSATSCTSSAPHPCDHELHGATCPNIDLWQWADEVDVVSNDHYLIAADDRNFVELALDADLTRSIALVNWQGRTSPGRWPATPCPMSVGAQMR